MRFPTRALAPLAGVVLSGVLFVKARTLSEVARGDQLGPGFWPRLVLAGLALACLAKLLGEVRSGLVGRGPISDAAGAPAVDDPLDVSRVRLFLGIALIVLYVGLTPWIGFPLATAAFIVAFMRACGTTSVVALASNAVVGTVGLLYLFVRLVYLPLPKGDGLFEPITLALYRALHIL